MIPKMSYMVIVLLGLFASGWSFLEHDSWITIELHHSLSPSKPDYFTHRGNISIPSLNSGLSTVVQNELEDSELEDMKILTSQNGFYRLKATVTYPNGNSQRFLTSSKACSLLTAQFNDVLWISLDAYGFVTGITASQDPTPNSSGCSAEDIQQIKEKRFSTDVIIRHAELAPVPDTGSFIQKFEREREARERGEVRDNRGFFAKYWMYIVPVVLLVFISGATNQDAAK
ncbi:ER membrane protein complex subunit 10 [Drosophila innubila]|uniref:ER membrane protein complex subunit 10 n=1 Tax=Drosophila innubila TaxID=198719 RepID=UPI00148D7632|nr:ER membrane protein complex subunit 10 [Drosophila innubila]